MAAERPRILQSQRDMIYSLIPLVLICVILAGIASQCSFSPGGPKSGPVPRFDVDAALNADAESLDFPIRNPKVPDGWQPNSGSRATVSGDKVESTVGYITPPGRYVQLTQSNATEDDLVPFVMGQRSATGTAKIGARTWVVYDEPGSEPGWVANFGDVRVLIRGSGDKDEFTALAAAVAAAQPLTR